MNETFFIRLKQFIDYKEISNNKFAEKIGVSSAQMSHMINGSKFGIDKLLTIISTFPEINSQWLLTGEGKMLKAESKLEGVVEKPPPESIVSVEYLEKIIKEQKKEISDLNKEIGRLEGEVNALINKYINPSTYNANDAVSPKLEKVN